MRNLLANLFTVFVLAVGVAGWFGLQMYQTMHQQNTLTTPFVLQLERGDSLRTISNKLAQHNLLDTPAHFVWWARLRGDDKRLQAGDYEILPRQSLLEVLNNMVAGKVQQFGITLVEGWNFRQMMQAINQHEHLDHTLKGLDDAALMAALGYPGEHPEGRFAPDTYYVRNQEKDSELLQRAYRSMAQTLETLWQDRAPELPYKNSYEALIMASIIEKESAVAEERPLIGGVFINRLRKGMRLQTDPTVIYGIGESYDGDIRFRDLRTDTPYNTYTRKGLPPTPIAMPGAESIHAALHPADTDYLFFVAHSDSSGRHIFTSTLDEHEKMVDLHQRKR